MTCCRFRNLLAVAPLLGALLVPGAAAAQGFSAADLAGTWSAFQLATPTGNVSGTSVRSFRGPVTFDATGAVTAGTLTDDEATTFTVTGSLTLSPAGVVEGTLTLTLSGVSGSLEVREARLLLNKHTIVGASTIFGDVGLLTFVKLEAGQTFTLDGDLAGDWSYHEVLPITEFVGGTPDLDISNEATWTTGSITFHDTLSGNPFCTEADLTFSNGTTRAQRSSGATSFG